MCENGKQKIAIASNEVRQVSELMNLPADKFKEHFAGKSLGYVLSMKNMAGFMYTQAEKSEKEVSDLIARGNLSEKKELSARKTLNEVVSLMVSLKQKYMILEKMEKERSLA